MFVKTHESQQAAIPGGSRSSNRMRVNASSSASQQQVVIRASLGNNDQEGAWTGTLSTDHGGCLFSIQGI